MKIKYTGPSAVVEVVPHDPRQAPFVVERGEAVDVRKEVAKSLLEQDTWEAAEAPRKKTTSKE